MLVNVVFIQNSSMQFEGIADYRLVDAQDVIICAVICKPVATRSERVSIMCNVAKELEKISGKAVYVSADLDVYCDLGKSNLDCNTLVKKMIKRGTFITST